MIAGAARAGHDSNPNHLGPISWTLAFTLGVLTIVLAGCSSQNYTPAPLSTPSYYTPSHETYRTTHTEVASWYGPGFAGRRTSTGEVYNPEGLTAASTTLPLGSHVRVVNPDTGRSVVVRINDRGPYVRGRSLDLSHGAAQQIGLTGKGVGRVEVTPTARSTPVVTASRTTVYQYSSISAAPARNLRYVSYESRTTYTRRTRRRHRSHSYSSTRTVSNPIGAWLASAFPRF
ncbi:MAG: septal ring lytic transglycosylase RlpA family protein [Candidatus Binatus sp.]|uniref:septal ring lytic transglycosylase RlpA family protein n=1 Tax=Candidatus Binatus sp. TaxID=2811406 RepID=UPI003BAEAE75